MSRARNLPGIPGWILLPTLLSFLMLTPAAGAGPKTVRRTPHGKTVVRHPGPRTTVVVHPGWPLRRTPLAVIVRPPKLAVLVPVPGVYLAPVVFTRVVVAVPAGEALVWQDTDTFVKEDEWVEATFPVNERGRNLVLRVAGKLALDFAEVVFENGDSQVIDFNGRTLKDDTCRLLDFPDGRKVSHVRLVARARSDTATATVFMAK